jgi:hypothetical protein
MTIGPPEADCSAISHMNCIDFDRITGFFCFVGLYPVDPACRGEAFLRRLVDPVRKIDRQNSLENFQNFQIPIYFCGKSEATGADSSLRRQIRDVNLQPEASDRIYIA